MSNIIPLTKRDIEANYAPKLVSLPEGSTPYLLLAVVGFLSLAWSPFVTAGIAFLCWEGLAPTSVDAEKLSETESLILDLLEDQHPVTGETLNRVMRDIIGKCQGDRSIPSQLMAELAQKAYLDPSTNHYSIDHAGKRVHITTFAELRFCELFAENTGRRLAPVQAPIILGDSTRLEAIAVDATAVSDPAVASTNELIGLDGLFSDAPIEDETFDLAEALAIAPLEDAKSLLVMGEPGVGKGVFVERWKNAMLATHPDAILYAINPKPDARESHRWTGFKNVLNVVDEFGATQALASLKKIETALKQRLSNPSDIPFALVIDEYNTLSDLWTDAERAEAAKLIKRIARQGRSLRCRLLLAVHSPNADELSMTASDRACFTSVALARKNNQQTLRIAASNSFLFPGLPRTVIEQVQARKGQPEVLALCSEYDRMLILPTVNDAPKPPVAAVAPVEALSDAERLERLYRCSENALKPDLEKVFDYIISFMPNIGDRVKARDLYKDARSKTVGVTAENAAAYMQDLATLESDRFKFDQQTLNTGSISQFLTRIS